MNLDEEQVRAVVAECTSSARSNEKRAEMFVAISNFFTALTDVVVMVTPALKAQLDAKVPQRGDRRV